MPEIFFGIFLMTLTSDSLNAERLKNQAPVSKQTCERILPMVKSLNMNDFKYTSFGKLVSRSTIVCLPWNYQGRK